MAKVRDHRDGGRRLDGRDRTVAALRRLGPVSRAELARRTDLAASTVSGIVTELMQEGLVVEVESPAAPVAGPKGGRPAVQLTLHRSAGVAVGIDLGKSHVRVAVADLSHTLMAERTVAVPPDRPASEVIEAAAAIVDETLAEAGAHLGDVVGVGMGIPGPVDAAGHLGDSTILPGWVGVPAAQAMGEALGLPVQVDNDANLGALAEWTWGAGRGHSEVAYLKASTGIGAGLIMDGRPLRGAGGTVGEIGHVVVDPSGPICRCGNRGCLEMIAGTGAVLGALRPTHGQDLTMTDVLTRAREGDEGCRRAIADAGHALGLAVATLCNLLNPARVVVGGELGQAGDLLLEPLRATLLRHAIRSAAQDVGVVEAELAGRAEVLGAVVLGLRSGAGLSARLPG